MSDRSAAPDVGPHFFDGEDGVMFKFVIDGGSIIGPRRATSVDQEKHPGAWAAFAAENGVSGLDRDARGGDGGSLPGRAKARRGRG